MSNNVSGEEILFRFMSELHTVHILCREIAKGVVKLWRLCRFELQVISVMAVGLISTILK